MILYISDFDLSGSGYMRIGTRLCNELVLNHDTGVIAIGLGYDRREHPWPFSIAPCPNLQAVPIMVQRIKDYGAPIEAIVVALDIPLQESLLRAMNMPGDIPYIGIFPLEAGPLCMPWAMQLLRMDARLIMSRFGQRELELAGVDSEFVPIGIDDLSLWRPPTPGERKEIRQGLGIDDDTFVITTVADNQERKNLSGAAEIVADFSVEVLARDRAGFVTEKRDKRKVLWNLVTRIDSPVGWKLDDLAMRLGIFDKMALYNRGVPAKSLWSLFAAADCFLLTSKAEGLALPVLEAMACGLPVVATDCTAMREHLSGRGFLISPEYEYTDPFGNGTRYLASRDHGVGILLALASDGARFSTYQVEDAVDYVAARTWEGAGDILAQTVNRVAEEKGTRIGKSETADQAPQATIPEAVGAPA